MPVVAVTNYKGGVGKTTSTLNLAAALHEAGRRVLVVDLDPQANLTIYAGFKDVDAVEWTLSEIMQAYLRRTNEPLVVPDGVIRSLPSGLDLLPGNRKLVQVEQELVRADNREFILRSILAGLRDEYDFVIIDCLPGAGLLAMNALAAADFVLVPVQAEYLAMQGLAYLLQSVAHARSTINPRLQILGVLMTMVDLRTLHSREIIEAVRQVFQNEIRVFYSMVRVDVKLRESTKAGSTILEYAPTSRGAEAYRSLAQEILAILPDYLEDPNRGAVTNPDLALSVADTATGLELKAMADGHESGRNGTVESVSQSSPPGDPRPTEGAPVVAADARPSEATPAAPGVEFACPKLALAEQPGQHANGPHPNHQCFAAREPLTLSLKRQESLCLTAGYRQCPLYVRHALISAEEARREQEAASGGLRQRLFAAFRRFGR